MTKYDEKETLRRLELLTEVKPTPAETAGAMERARQALGNMEKKQGNIRLWRTSGFAAAAVIILAIGIFAVYHRPNGQAEKPGDSEFTQKPTYRMTAMSYRMAYRRGGLEAIDKLGSRRLKPRSTRLTVKDLIMELDEETGRNKL